MALSDREGHFLAGLIEGESHLAIIERNGGQSFGCSVAITMRDDELSLLMWIRERLGGCIRRQAAVGNAHPQACWTVATKAGSAKLADVLGTLSVAWPQAS